MTIRPGRPPIARRARLNDCSARTTACANSSMNRRSGLPISNASSRFGSRTPPRRPSRPHPMASQDDSVCGDGASRVAAKPVVSRAILATIVSWCPLSGWMRS